MAEPKVSRYGKTLSDGTDNTVKSRRSKDGSLNTSSEGHCTVDDLAKAADEFLVFENNSVLKRLGFQGNLGLGPSNGFSDLLSELTGSSANSSDELTNQDKNTMVELLSRSLTDSISGARSTVSIFGGATNDFFTGIQGSTISPNVSITGTNGLGKLAASVRDKDGVQAGIDLRNFVDDKAKLAADSANGLLGLSGLTMFNDPRSIFDIAQDAVGNLGTLFIDKNEVLDDVDRIIDKILNLIQEIDEEWFKVDKTANIDTAIKLLKNADERLSRVKNSLRTGGEFRSSDMDSARTDMEKAEDFLRRFKVISGIDIDFDTLINSPVAHVKIIALVIELRSLGSILETREKLINEAKESIDKFGTEIAIDVDLEVEDTVTPITAKLKRNQAQLVSQVQQEIRALIRAMESVNNTDDLVKLFTLTKSWALQIKLIRKLADLIGKDIDDYLKLDPDDYKFEFKKKIDFLDDFNFPDTTPLIEKIEEYASLTVRRLSFDANVVLDFPGVNGDKDKAAQKADEITQGFEDKLQLLNTEIHQLVEAERVALDDVQIGLGGKIGPGLQKFIKIQQMMKESGFDRASDILCSGNLSGFLGLTSEKMTQAGNLVEKFNCALSGGLQTENGSLVPLPQSRDTLEVKRFVTNQNRERSIGQPSFMNAFLSSRNDSIQRFENAQSVKAAADNLTKKAVEVDSEVATRNEILGS